MENLTNINGTDNVAVALTTEIMAVAPHQRSLSVIGITFLTLTIVLVVTLNPLCLLILRRASSIQETTKMFMASLTVTDLCSGIFVAIPLLLELINNGTWVLGNFLCTISGIVIPTFYTLDCLSLVLLSVDRYIAIIHPLRYSSLMTKRSAGISIGLLWVATFTVHIVWFGIFVRSEVSGSGNWCVFPCQRCFFSYHCVYVVSVGIIVVVYVRILKVARSQARRIAAQNHIGNPARQNEPQPVSTKSASTVILITTTLCVCWAPSFIALSLYAFGVAISSTALIVIQTGFFTNCWLNVVIYYWRNRELRQTIHRVVSLCCH